MEINFNGKRALVTGAGRGIGYAIVKALVAGGAETVALSKTQANLDILKKEVPGVKTVCVDLSNWDQTREVVTKLGHFDLVVNNAATALLDSVLEATPEDIDLSMTINVKAAINIIQVVAKSMKERGTGGSIVNLSSQASMRALGNHLSYGTSKAAIDQVTRQMTKELGPFNIRVNAVNPTVVLTEMGKIGWSNPEKAASMLSRIPMGKFAEVEDVVHPVLFLLSDKAAMINGITLPVDGGFLAC